MNSLVYLLPLSLTIIVPFTVILCYVIAVSKGHVEVFLPYISETGILPPESDIFAQMLNIIAVLAAATVYVRYKIIEKHFQQKQSELILRLNSLSLPFGFLMSLGASIVANFRADELIYIHTFGAMCLFFLGFVYLIIHSWISFLSVPFGINTLFIAKLRLTLSLIMLTSIISTASLGYWSFKLFRGNDQMHWKPSDGGYIQHIISTSSEWMIVIANTCGIATVINEFKVNYNRNILLYSIEKI